MPARPAIANVVNTMTIAALAAQSDQRLTVNLATMHSPAGPSVSPSLMSVIVSVSRPSTKNDPATLLKSVVLSPPAQERSLADCYNMQTNRWLNPRRPLRPAVLEADYLG